jgi:uncharacterized membrane protein YtjA (UPF0391 family)
MNSYSFFSLGIIFLVISLIAYAIGARGTAGMSAGIGRLFILVGLILFVLFLIVGINRPAGWW